MSFGGGKTTDNGDTIQADVAEFSYLTVTQNTVLNNLTVTGACNIPGGVISQDINCNTLTANSFVKAQNNTSEYALLQTTSSTDPDPNQSILSTSTGSQGLDIITLGSGKKIQMFTSECNVVVGYNILPTLPGGIALFSNSSLTLDASTFININADTNAELTSTQALKLEGGSVASLEAKTSKLTLRGVSAEFSTTGLLTGSLDITGQTSASLTAFTGALSLSGATAATLTSSGVLTLTGASTIVSSTVGNVSLATATGDISLQTAVKGNITLHSKRIPPLGGYITLSNRTVITPPLSLVPGIHMETELGGVITMTSDAGGIALTTGVGGIALSVGAGPIVLSTAALGTIQLGALAGGAINVITGTDAVNFAAPLGGINFGVTGGASTVGQFTVWASNNATGAATGNISLTTHGTGALTGPGDITIDASDAYTGNMFLRSKGTFKIVSNNGNFSSGIFLNTSAASAAASEYNWRFPAGPGTAGQVLTSGGSSSAQTWSTVIAADANGNISANNFFSASYTISTTGTYNMTAASPFYNLVTANGAAVEVFLPNAATLPNGAMYYFNVNGTSTVNVKRFGSGTVVSLTQGSYVTIELLSNATTAGTWDYQSALPSNVTWNTSAVSFPQTLTSTNTTLAGPGSGAIVTSGGVSGVNCWMTSDYVIQNGVGGSFVSIRPANAVYGPYNFRLPSGPGTAGQVLTSGGGTNDMYWTTPAGGGGGGISSVGMSVPSFLSVSPGNITSTGTFAVTYSGSALPVANGGTGVTTSTGSGANVLGTSPILTTVQLNQGASQQAALVYPTANDGESSIFFLSQTTNTGGRWSIGHNIGGGADTFSIYSTTALASIILLSSTLATFNTKMTCSNTTVAGTGVNNASIYSAGGISARNAFLREDLVLEYTPGSFVSVRPFQGVFTPFNFILPSTAGSNGDFLKSNGTSTVWGGAVTSVGMTVPSFMSVSPATITSTGTFAITAASTGTGSVVLSNTPTINNRLLVAGDFVTEITAPASNTIAQFTTPFLTPGNTTIVSIGQIFNNDLQIQYRNDRVTFAFNNDNFFRLTATEFTTNKAISSSISGAATSNTNFFVPSLANGNLVNLNFGISTTTNNCGTIQFFNSGGSGSSLNSINMGVYGVNCMTMKPTDTSFFQPCSFPSVSATTVTTDTVTANFDLNLVAASGGFSRRVTAYAGSAFTGGIYINAQTTTSNVTLPTNQRGCVSIGNYETRASCFIGQNQEKFGAVGLTPHASLNVALGKPLSQTSSEYFVSFYETNTITKVPSNESGNISYNPSNGGCNYNSQSDYRVKTNVQNMPSMFELINTLRPVTYQRLIPNPLESVVHGFIAHEVQQVFPEAVTGEKDAVDPETNRPIFQQVSYASFTPMLTKAVQELIALVEQQQQTIESLSQRITLLESL